MTQGADAAGRLAVSSRKRAVFFHCIRAAGLNSNEPGCVEWTAWENWATLVHIQEDSVAGGFLHDAQRLMF